MVTKVRRGTKGEVIQARVLSAKKDLLDRYAAAQDKTTSGLVRVLIDEYIRVVENKIATGEIEILPSGEMRLHPQPHLSYNLSQGAPIGSR